MDPNPPPRAQRRAKGAYTHERDSTQQFSWSGRDRGDPAGSLNGLDLEGAPVLEFIGTLAELFPQIPVFSRHPFRSGGEENRYKDEIRRGPLK